MVNGVVRGTEHSQIITSVSGGVPGVNASVASGMSGLLSGQLPTIQSQPAQTSTGSTHLQLTTSAQPGQPLLGTGQQTQGGGVQPATQQYIAIDPTTGINYKVDMALTSELGSDPLAAIMNETIFQDTSGAIVPGDSLTLALS